MKLTMEMTDFWLCPFTTLWETPRDFKLGTTVMKDNYAVIHTFPM